MPLRSKKVTLLSDIGERELLRRVRRWFGEDAAPGVAVGIGDDCCALTPPKTASPLLLSTDTMVENVHFKHSWISGRDLGERAMAVNLSDLAAMGAKPVAALMALCLPPSTPLSEISAFFHGVHAASERYACPLTGGDLTRSETISISITVVGRPASGHRAVLRSTARPGQILYVTGCPGEAGAGRSALEADIHSRKLIARLNRPSPRIEEGSALAESCRRLSMLDVSDGIWNDAEQMAEASGVGIIIDYAALPVSPAMVRLGMQLKRDPREWTLFGGDDYELLFTTDSQPGAIEHAIERAGVSTAITAIGRIVEGSGVRLAGADNETLIMPDHTFQHFKTGETSPG